MSLRFKPLIIVSLFVSLAAILPGAPFGSVIPVGGHVSDLALDERRSVIYLANFAARRIEVVSIPGQVLQSPISVAAQPCCLALSPDQRFLVVGHYGSGSPATGPVPSLTILDLDANQRRTVVLPASPLAVAFGAGDKAFVVTSTTLLLVEPLTGTLTNLTESGLTSLTLPTAAPKFPPEIVQASTAVSGDGQVVYVLAQGAATTGGGGGTPPPGGGGGASAGVQAIIRYDVATQTVAAVSITSAPALGPRVISTDNSGDRILAGWSLVNRRIVQLAQFPYPTGILNVGAHAIDDRAGIIYGQIPKSANEDPTLSIFDLDNLTLRERIQLSENLAGRAILTRDRQTLYAASDSGLTVLPVGNLARAPRVAATAEDVVFRGNFCTRDLIAAEVQVVDPGGNRTPFSVTGAPRGVRVTASSSSTPATLRIEVDPTQFQNQRGTTEAFLQIQSTAAVNYPPPIRLLINTQEPEQRGALINVPGRLVDLLADPARNRLYVLRQDKNLVYVFEANGFTPIAQLRTGNTPVQMAVTQDSRHLIVTADNSQLASVFDRGIL